MSSDIAKLSVFDDRILQTRPQFAVNKGALSVTNAPFNAISATTSQSTFNIYVPSENVFVDRKLQWSSTVYLQGTVTYTVAPAVGAPVAVLGKDIALTAFPLNSMLSTLQATINDTTVTANSQDVLRELLRLTDYKDNRLQRTCPTYLDTYLAYADGNGAINTPLGSYSSATTHDMVPNGAFYDFEYTDPAGVPLVGTNNYVSGGVTVQYAGGVPVGDGATLEFPLFFRFRSTEALVLSPFIFADDLEDTTGLFGINNIQVICNTGSPARLLRNDPTSGGVLSAVGFNLAGNNSKPIDQAVINVQFLTPSLDVELPPKSVVPYLEAPRYISQPANAIAPGASDTIVSQTLTLPLIPDAFIIYVKALKAPGTTAAQDPTLSQFADGYLSVDADSRSPLQVQFDNFSGLLSSHTAQQLYGMSIRAGLEMDWNQWVGRAQKAGANPGPGQVGARGARVGLTGGPLVLRPGVDITLQPGQAPSLVGNFTLQINLRVRNNYAFDVVPQMYIVTLNSGFFESIRGSSRVIKGVLSEQDIISAPMAGSGSSAAMHRLVGAGFMSKLGNALSRAKDIYHATKPAVSALKGALPEGKAKQFLGMAGYGMEGCGTGAGTGAGMHGGRARRSMADRLM